MKLKACVACGSEKIETIMDWGDMPLANNYNIKEKFPLRLNLCNNCHHLQLDETVDPEIMFRDYPYFSGTSKTSTDYFMEIAEMALRHFPDAKTTMDLASNDGAQLDAFKQLGLKTYGIDPAHNLCTVARNKGHNIFCGFFPDYLPDTKYDIITAQNVVAHVPNPLYFIKGCREIMHDESILYIATSQANLVTHTEFDTCYHEHISYFNTLSMKTLVERADMVLDDVFTNPIHGTSYIFAIRKTKRADPVDVRIEDEKQWGLHEKNTYDKWVIDCLEKAGHNKKKIDDYREQGYKIVGCGAAAKGITFLNMSGTQMDFIVDTTPAKWYNGVCNTTIYPFEYLRTIKDEKVLFVILAWNFEKEITETVRKYRDNSNDIFTTTND